MKTLTTFVALGLVFMVLTVTALNSLAPRLACREIAPGLCVTFVTDNLRGYPRVGEVVEFKPTTWMQTCGIDDATVSGRITGYQFAWWPEQAYPVYSVAVAFDAPPGYTCANEFTINPEALQYESMQ